MPVETSIANGFREISDGLIVCNACGKVHQVYGVHRMPLKCETCNERFVKAPVLAIAPEEEGASDVVHYELDCPECKTHYEIDLPSGPVIFDCGECGCSFTVEEESGFRKTGSQASAGEAVVEMRSGTSKKRRLPKRALLSISEHKKKLPWLNSFLSFIVATLLCIGFVVYLIMQAFDERSLGPSPQEGNIVPRIYDAGENNGGERHALFSVRKLGDRETRAFIAALEGFVKAPGLEEKVRFCRFPGVTGVRMQDYYADKIYEADPLFEPEGVEMVEMVELATGQVFLQTRYRHRDGTEAVYVAEALAGGSLAFEWEPTVVFSEIPWGEIEGGLIDRPVTALVRIQKSTRYSAELSLDEYASYQIFHREPSDGFVAYAEIGSEIQQTLDRVFTQDQFPLTGVNDRPSTKRVMVKFEFPGAWNPDGKSRYGRILEVVQEDWVRYER